jgi:GT2 family glycosyltransferase
VAQTLDIVIPVYRGEAETRACLESVLASRCERAVEVVVIDDRSPEPAISEWLRSLAAGGRITLIAHATNLGFVASVNEAMALHPGRDVILLNSDTEVAPGWVDRLWAHFQADPAIGTATPFSNNATICSYPKTLQANALPPGETTAGLDADFATANPGRRVEIPTAVGFCMAISRRCLDRVGLFDYERYGAGYGEEVDFCMRAARAGMRSVLAGDVFVRHRGEVSFGGEGAERRARAQAIVDELYPEFQQRLAEFIPADPTRMLRRRADLARLRHDPMRMRYRIEEDGTAILDWPGEGEDFVLHTDSLKDADAVFRLMEAITTTGPIPELDPKWLSPLAEPPLGGLPRRAGRPTLLQRLRRLF